MGFIGNLVKSQDQAQKTTQSGFGCDTFNKLAKKKKNQQKTKLNYNSELRAREGIPINKKVTKKNCSPVFTETYFPNKSRYSSTICA